jgi:mutator protein MutT
MSQTSNPIFAKRRTLVFLLRDKEVLLAMKKRGFGMGKWNGVGGKIEEGETVPQAAIREAQEEIGVVIQESDLTHAGTIQFLLPEDPDNKNMNVEVFVYTTTNWEGEPTESEEMAPKWFHQNEISYDQMWEDDHYWLPLVLKGQRIKATFSFMLDPATGKEKLVDHDIHEISAK